MKWLPGNCEPGDLIRVHLGAICHYGVFVSPDEVIQFGEPPVRTLDRDDASLSVCATDMEGFACGQIVEIARPEKGDPFRRRPTGEIIRSARDRLGEKGYSLLHNNCEHFAYECVYGVRYCEQEETVRSRLRSRPVLDVYVAKTSEFPSESRMPVCAARCAEIARTADPGLKESRTADWLLLEDGLFRSLGLRADRLTFKKALNGKWHCAEAFFSLSHSEHFVCAAVSNRPVGVDLEEPDMFARRFSGPDALGRLVSHICGPREERPCDIGRAMTLWMRKESLYKASEAMIYAPKRIAGDSASVRTGLTGTDPVTALAVSGEHLRAAKIWLFLNRHWELRTLA